VSDKTSRPDPAPWRNVAVTLRRAVSRETLRQLGSGHGGRPSGVGGASSGHQTPSVDGQRPAGVASGGLLRPRQSAAG
jgi:hypothetical protein